MRRIMIPVMAFGLVALPAAAEAQATPRAERAQFGARAGGHGGGPAARVLGQREALGLSAAQVAELERIRADFEARNAPLLEQLRAARPGMAQRARPTEEQRAEMRQRREQMQQMTPEQRAEMRQRMQQMTPEERAGMRQRMQAMTPEQRQQMGERMRGMRGQGRGMSEESRARMEALRPVMEQLRQNHAQAREQVHAVLTAEQAAQLQQRMRRPAGERPGGEIRRRGPGARR